MISFAIGFAIAGYVAQHRFRVGLPSYGVAIFLTGLVVCALEYMGFELAALGVGLVYALLYVQSQVTIVKHGLPEF